MSLTPLNDPWYPLYNPGSPMWNSLLKLAFDILFRKPDKRTTRIAILGLKASGKTTLWNGLRGARFSPDYQVTAKDRVRSFTIKKGGKELTIEENYDIGGGNQWVRDYDDLIKDGTFVFFLVDATDKKPESRSSIRSRIQKFFEHMQTMKNCGARILVTHIDECNGIQRGEIISSIKEWLDLESVSINGKTAKYEYDAVNLTSASDIEYIKQMIIDNVYG